MPLHFLLLCALLLCNVLLRTFTNGFQVLPKIFNVIDIPIVALLFILSLAHRGKATPLSWARTISRRLLWFCVVLVLGAALNPGYFYLPAALSQVVMLVEPILLFVALTNLPITEQQITTYSRLLHKLVILQIAIGVLQLPARIQTGNSEAVHGTFTGNAEQYAAFLMIGIFYLIGLASLSPHKRKRYILAILLILVLAVSVDNKASWLGTACALALVLWRLDLLKLQQFRTLGPILLILSLGVGIAFLATRTSSSLIKYQRLWEVLSSGNATQLGKVKAYIDIARSHLTHPHMIFVGAGPSTMYSRASRQFYLDATSRQTLYMNPDVASAELQDVRMSRDAASSAMQGVVTRTYRAPYYLNFYSGREAIWAIGSGQVDTPFSPYAGLLGETGVLGFLLYVGIYGMTLRRLASMLPVARQHVGAFPILTAAGGLMLYILVNSVYGPFLETTRYTTLLWSMVALCAIQCRTEDLRDFESVVPYTFQTEGEAVAVSQPEPV